MGEILYLTNKDVRGLATMDDAIASLEAAFRHWKQGDTVNMPRRRLPLPGGKQLNYMAATLPAVDGFGYKAYFSLPKGGSQLVMLYSISEARLVAMVEAGVLGQLRTGAASGVATRYLAKEDASIAAVIGAGRHGRTQLMAVTRVRKIKRAKVFSRTAETREKFAKDVGAELGIEIVAAPSAQAAVEGADVVITATKGQTPVVLGDWLQPGVHINAMGANAATQVELDDAAVMKADLLVVDDLEQSKIEAGELIRLNAVGKLSWDSLHELGDVVRGTAPRRSSPGQITIFNSLGLALEDITFARLIYDRAKEKGVGTKLQTP
jgi:alanine dehydrogenase